MSVVQYYDLYSLSSLQNIIVDYALLLRFLEIAKPADNKHE